MWYVAPYVGAWIETTFVDDETGYEVSHPTWVRGLKLWSKDGCSTSKPSHPTWVRGLKHEVVELDEIKTYVAPYVGAWIETTLATIRTK